MEDGKLLDMLPENLREAFISEVEELLIERNSKGKITSKQAEDDIKAWAAKTNREPAKPVAK